MPRCIYIFLTTLHLLLGLICSAKAGFNPPALDTSHTPSKNSFAPLPDLCVSAVPLLSAAQGYDITNAYNAEGRRFSKKVNRYQNGQIVEQKHITFLHDGNDLIYERHQLPSGLTLLERKYIWGPDIAGGNAGGAGGLLLIRETIGNVTTDLFPLYDGTGHVVALTDTIGTLRAEYAYGPFGELIYARGPNASSCPFRYATKYWDEETRLYNFGKRFFDPITGQWLSREPLGESESLNLYSYCGNDPVNFVDVLGLAKVATDGRGNLTALGQVILDVAKGDPNAARSLLMASQVSAEISGANVAGQAQGEDAIRNVTRAIETAVGQAQSDGRNEWKLIAPQAGADSYFGGYKDAWMSAKLAEYAPMIAANAETAIQLRAAERTVNDKATAYQNSAAYKLREFADVPFDVAAFGISAGAASDVTTGNAVTWNGWNNGGGFGLAEVTPGERAFATAMVFLPVGRVGGVADDFVRVGFRAERSFARTAARPWGKPLALTYDASTVTYQAGKIRSFVTEVDETFYRVYSGNNATGSFLSRVKPKSADWAMEAFALPTGNTADFIQEVLVPAGTRLQRSRAAPNVWGRGGAEQFELLKLFKGQYQPVQFGPGIPFR